MKSQFGYHIVQVEERQPAHAQTLNEVLPTIQATLIRQKAAAAEENYAHALTSEAIKNGLEKTAAAHHLEVVTTPLVGRQGVIAALPDGSQVIAKAFDIQAGRSAAVRAHRRGLCDLPGHRHSRRRTRPLLPIGRATCSTTIATSSCRAAQPPRPRNWPTRPRPANDLAKAAKEVGATVKTSDLVAPTARCPTSARWRRWLRSSST